MSENKMERNIGLMQYLLQHVRCTLKNNNNNVLYNPLLPGAGLCLVRAALPKGDVSLALGVSDKPVKRKTLEKQLTEIKLFIQAKQGAY